MSTPSQTAPSSQVPVPHVTGQVIPPHAGSTSTSSSTSAPSSTSTSTSTPSSSIGGTGSLLEQAQKVASDALSAAQPYIAKAQETVAPVVGRVDNALGHPVEKAKDLYNKNVAGTTTEDVKAKTSAAADDLSRQASATTNSATSEGSKDVESAKGYLSSAAGSLSSLVGSAVQTGHSLASSAAHTIDDATKSASHPGLATQLGNALHSASNYVSGAANEVTSDNGKPIGTAIHDAASSKADEAGIKSDLSKLASGGGHDGALSGSSSSLGGSSSAYPTSAPKSVDAALQGVPPTLGQAHHTVHGAAGGNTAVPEPKPELKVAGQL